MRVMDTLKGAALVITLFAFIATCATVRKQERIAR